MIARNLRSWACVALLTVCAATAFSQRRRDPLSQPEIDQVRDASWEPQQRLTLYVKFARARLVKLEQMRNDPKSKDRAQQTHDMLDDFLLQHVLVERVMQHQRAA